MMFIRLAYPNISNKPTTLLTKNNPKFICQVSKMENIIYYCYIWKIEAKCDTWYKFLLVIRELVNVNLTAKKN